ESDGPGLGGVDMEQDRSGDVVGEIAHDSERRGERRKIEPTRVGLVHRQTLLGKALAQARAQVPVQLDGVQVLDALKKRRGQRAQPGAYFDDVLAAPRIDRRDDALDDSPLDEKVLTEPL